MPSSPTFKSLLLAICAFASCALSFADDAPKVQVEYFYQHGCHACELIRSLVLPRIEERFSSRYELKGYDIALKENFLRLAGYQERLDIKGNEPVTMVVQGRIALTGYKEIDSGLAEAIDEAISNQATPDVQPSKMDNGGILEKRSERITLIAVICAGLLDGIDPCAFSTLVFFISLLAVAKVRDARLIAVGVAYCLASFLTYSALGFGLFKFIKAMTAFHAIQGVFNYGMAALLLLMAALSFRDAFRYSRSGKAADVTLQLPGAMKSLIHMVMKRGLGYRWLIPGSFAIGVAVTLLESVCTGQVYLPTLALLAKECPETLKWASMIVLYNIMFTVPLIAVFMVAWSGVRTPRLLDWSKRNVTASKIMLGLLFLALAVMIVWL